MNIQYATASAVAERLQFSPRTVRRLAAQGEIPGATRVGTKWRFNVEAFEQWCKEKEEETRCQTSRFTKGQGAQTGITVSSTITSKFEDLLGPAKGGKRKSTPKKNTKNMKH